MESGLFYNRAQGLKYAMECRDEGAQESTDYLLAPLELQSQVERFEMVLANEVEPHHGLYVDITEDEPGPEQDTSASCFKYFVKNVARTLYGESIQAMTCDVHALTVRTQETEVIVHPLMIVGERLGTLAGPPRKSLLKSILKFGLIASSFLWIKPYLHDVAHLNPPAAFDVTDLSAPTDPHMLCPA